MDERQTGSVSIPPSGFRPGSTPRPPAALAVSNSPATRNDVTQANTGSSEKISAVRVGVVNRCAQVCTENASAVASRLVTASATITPGARPPAAARSTRT